MFASSDLHTRVFDRPICKLASTNRSDLLLQARQRRQPSLPSTLHCACYEHDLRCVTVCWHVAPSLPGSVLSRVVTLLHQHAAALPAHCTLARRPVELTPFRPHRHGERAIAACAAARSAVRDGRTLHAPGCRHSRQTPVWRPIRCDGARHTSRAMRMSSALRCECSTATRACRSTSAMRNGDSVDVSLGERTHCNGRAANDSERRVIRGGRLSQR